MTWVYDRWQEQFVPIHAAAIFGRTRPRAIQTPRNGIADGIAGKLVLDVDPVFRRVAEVVLVHTRCSFARKDLIQSDAAVVDGSRRELVVGVREPKTGHDELVQMGVGPTHHDLQDFVEAWKQYILIDED